MNILFPNKKEIKFHFELFYRLPVNNDIGDGYSGAMHATEDECLSTYSQKCPYSIVGYILQSQSSS